MSPTGQTTLEPERRESGLRWSECFLDSLSESQRAIIDALRLFDLASVHYDTLAVLVTSANFESDLQWLVSTRILDCEDRRYRLADDLRTFLPASAVLDETKRRYVSSIAREIRNHRADQERLRGEFC